MTFLDAEVVAFVEVGDKPRLHRMPVQQLPGQHARRYRPGSGQSRDLLRHGPWEEAERPTIGRLTLARVAAIVATPAAGTARRAAASPTMVVCPTGHHGTN